MTVPELCNCCRPEALAADALHVRRAKMRLVHIGRRSTDSRNNGLLDRFSVTVARGENPLSDGTNQFS